MSIHVVLERDFIFVHDERDPFAFGIIELQDLCKVVDRCRQYGIPVYIQTENGIIEAQKVSLKPEKEYLEKVEYKDGAHIYMIYIQGKYIHKFDS